MKILAYYINYLMDNFDLKSQGLGSGSRVLSYGDKAQRVALKMVSSVNTKECQLLKNQYLMLKLLRHPHIVQAFKLKEIGCEVGKQSLTLFRHRQTVMVIEFASKGSLLDLLLKQPPSLGTLKSLFTDVLSATLFSHTKGVAHRDIKLQNILVFSVNGQQSAKLGDFGLASVFKQGKKEMRLSGVRGSWRYMAPEIWETGKQKEGDYDVVKADCFSLGVTLFAMLYRKLPFGKAINSDSLYALLIQKNYAAFWTFHGAAPSLQDTPLELQDFKSLFLQMVSCEPTERPQLQIILKNPFFMRQI